MDDSSFNLDISVGNLQECPPQRRNIYGSVIAESESAPEANVREPIAGEPNRSFCDCKSACKTKQKNGVGRGCPCRTANLSCVQNRCKCGTGPKQCANRNVQTVSQRNLPSSSMERQRRDIENTRQEIQEFVDALDVGQVRRLMVLLINNGRGSLDFARRLVTREDQEPQPGPTNNALPGWCICNNCIQMPTPEAYPRGKQMLSTQGMYYLL